MFFEHIATSFSHIHNTHYLWFYCYNISCQLYLYVSFSFFIIAAACAFTCSCYSVISLLLLGDSTSTNIINIFLGFIFLFIVICLFVISFSHYDRFMLHIRILLCAWNCSFTWTRCEITKSVSWDDLHDIRRVSTNACYSTALFLLLSFILTHWQNSRETAN